MSASRRALRVFVASCLVLPLPVVTQTVIATVPVGSIPVALAINSTTNKIFIVNQGSNNVTVIDPVTNGTAYENVGRSPAALAVNSATNKVYIANQLDNTVSVIDGATNTNIATVASGSTPRAVAVNQQTNRIYVVNYDSNNVTVIDGARNSIIASVGVGYRPQALGVNLLTNKIYVANSGNGTVTVLDGRTNSTVAIVWAGSSPCAVAVNSLTNTIYVANQVRNGTVSVIDGKTDTPTATVAVGNSPASVAVDAVTNMIYAANYGDNTASVIDGSTNLATATLAVGLSPGPVAVNPVTHALYVANFYDGTVSVINGRHGSVTSVKVGSNPDAVALNPLSNRIYVANSLDGTVSVIAGVDSDPLRFIPVTPCRVADTRNPNGPFGGPAISGGTSRDFTIPASACGVPTTAAAYSLNVTVVPVGALGYLTTWPTGQEQPYVSTLNSVDGRVKANAAIVPAGAGGAVSIFASNTTDVVLDINGYFAAVSDSTFAFYRVDPCRVVDTRGPDGPLGGPFLRGGAPGRDFPITSSGCNIPSQAVAYSLNFTAVPKGPLGYLTTWPTGQSQPWVSTLNALTGLPTANAAIVPAGVGGDIDVFVSNDSDVVIDVNGYFAPAWGGRLSLYTTAPCRVLDTRSAWGLFSGTLVVNVTGSSCGMPNDARAYVLNATVVPQGSLGYLTLWPNGGPQPYVSTLNAIDGVVTSNMAIVPTYNGYINAFAPSQTQLVLDSSSYFGP